tara:strand:- start:38 stop:211 length:174 start_codon:yes stop_codon:yes gene_type:complete
MKRYSVKIREVHEQQIFVSAKDVDDAKEKAAEGLGDLDNDTRFLYALDSDTWEVEED